MAELESRFPSKGRSSHRARARRRPKPKTRTPTRRTAAPPSRLTDGRTFFAAPQMNASTNARAAIEVSAEDMEEVNSAQLELRRSCCSR